MPMIGAYHRPTSVEAALELLGRPDVATAALGGGTALLATLAGDIAEVVDLQALDLASVSREGALLQIGAMVTLRDLIDHEMTPPLLRDLARREAPNTFRNVATIGGTIGAADPESGLLAGLLAAGATVTLTGRDGSDQVGLADLLADPDRSKGSLITAVAVAFDGVGAFEVTARTPADTPIVLVAGHRSADGIVTLAAAGLAAIPTIIDGSQVAETVADFRGTAEFRSHLAAVLSERVLTRLAGEQP